jgi:hypothetical protein
MKSEGTVEAYIRQNEKNAVFLGEERKKIVTLHTENQRRAPAFKG